MIPLRPSFISALGYLYALIVPVSPIRPTVAASRAGEGGEP